MTFHDFEPAHFTALAMQAALEEATPSTGKEPSR